MPHTTEPTGPAPVQDNPTARRRHALVAAALVAAPILAGTALLDDDGGSGAGPWDTIARCESTANWVSDAVPGPDYRSFGTGAAGPADEPVPAPPSGCPGA